MENAELIARTGRLREMIGLRHEPLAFFHSDAEPEGYHPPAGERGCLVGVLGRARQGEVVYFDAGTVGCAGGGYYLGFCEPRPEIAEFVSTGIPGQLPGERYKKTPELVRAHLQRHAAPPAPARYAVFAPISRLKPEQRAAVVICFGGADELAGLVGLAGYARAEEAVIAPFGSGCSTLVTYPLAEGQRDLPRAVLGMFDPSARPHLAPEELSFAAPVALWEEMISNAEESFLSTPTWTRLRTRPEEGGSS
ncbi:MAG: DUF169 domain-containing protein [candidate division WS1 bacterium]|jgi:hypothetical protein|nr:DUF169 domain-containing protein [candidate division WS1 bacterium]